MSEQYLGEIRMFGGNFAPEGWAFCNGQLLSISQNDALYTLLGTTYGGDGVNTFALPDLQGRLPVHTGRSSASGKTYTLGEKAGSESVTLIMNQLPAHSHAAYSSSLAGTTSSPENAFWAASDKSLYSDAASNATLNAAAIGVTGGSQPHDNMMPYTAISFIISLTGVYPSQS
ncbi:tail fiber protein [Paenibacillus glycanilyticus]|uniref:phage tail protein n=1 Tax=Paenibacillus glycanilyticus TaxID=126569 RepID=UPI00203F0EA2|nr:tail fiber protein [Paenibacillus glycanilyticus]MCM3628986.1 tail fiber protein [Paenibacillus glycanilyticus]